MVSGSPRRLVGDLEKEFRLMAAGNSFQLLMAITTESWAANDAVVGLAPPIPSLSGISTAIHSMTNHAGVMQFLDMERSTGGAVNRSAGYRTPLGRLFISEKELD
jgi:hypothetical protein